MSNAANATAPASVAGFPQGSEGVTPPTSPEGTGGFLSDVIIELGLVDRGTVEQAVDAAREPGRRVDQILLERGALTEEELSRAVAERYGLDHVDLARFEVDMRAAGLISPSSALRYRAVPIAFATDGALIVAVADPVDALAISDVEVMTKTETRRAVASGTAIDALAERLPQGGARQPAPNGPDPVDTVSPPPAAPPTAGSEAQPSPPSPATEAPGDPSRADGSAAAASVEDVRASDAAADRKLGEAEARSAALEAKLAEAYDLLREQAGQGEAERDRLREQVTETSQERDRLRGALDQVTQERDRLSEERDRLREERDRLSEERDRFSEERDRLREERDRVSEERDRFGEEAQLRSEERASLLEQAARAERLAEEATGRFRELEDADHRAEAARLALRELREETEREREQSSRLERKLREELTVAEQRNAALERRLAGLMAAATEAKTMAEELMAVHGAITEDDIPSDRDRAPSATSTAPQEPVPGDGDSPGRSDPLPNDVQKPTI